MTRVSERSNDDRKSLRLSPCTTREALRRSRGAVVTADDLLGVVKHPRHIGLAEPALHPWCLAARPSPLSVFFGVSAGAARRVMRGEAWVVLDGGSPRVRVGRVLSRGARAELLERRRPPTTATLSAALESPWQTLDRANLGAAPRQRAWLRDHGAPPASLLMEALPVVDSSAMTPALLRRYRAVVAANAALARDRSDANRRALAIAVHAAWNALAERPGVAAPVTGSAVRMDACVLDGAMDPGACGLPAYVLRALFGRRLHDHLVATGRAVDLRDACDLVEHDPDGACDALDELCATHPVLLVRDAPTSHAHVASLRASRSGCPRRWRLSPRTAA